MNGPNHDPHNIPPQHLLGGHATGNLSEQEQEKLFSAALQDQQLFDALMDEEALKDILNQHGAKRELIDALQTQPSLLTRFRKWLTTPMGFGSAGVFATAALVIGFFATRLPQPIATTQVAKQETVASPSLESAPAPEARKAPPVRQPVAESKRDAAPSAAPTLERDKREEESAVKEGVQNQAIQQQPRQIQAMREQQQAAQVLDQQVQRQDSQQQMRSVGAAQQAPTQQAPAEAAPPPASQKAAAPIAPIQYVLLKRNDQGEYNPATTFRDSDAVRIHVTASQDGYLALTRSGEQKAIVSLTPVKAGQSLQLPASGFLLPSTQPYRLEFARQLPQAPGATGVSGGFRARPNSRVLQDELAKSKDASTAAAAQPTVIEILIKGTEN